MARLNVPSRRLIWTTMHLMSYCLFVLANLAVRGQISHANNVTVEGGPTNPLHLTAASSLLCKDISESAICTSDDVKCCYDGPSGTCFSPNLEEEFDCNRLSNQDSCAVWPLNCAWNAEASTCIRLAVNSGSNCHAVWTARLNQADNQYCWGARTRKGCVFPFTYRNNTYTKCTTDKSPSGSTHPWCVVGSSVVSAHNWESCECTPSKRPKSVVLFILDDLRPDLSAYGRHISKSPNIDDLLSRPGSVVFERAYAFSPLCAPSRAGFLSGLSPDFTKVVSSYGRGLSQSRTFRSRIKTLPQLFREQGFYTAGGGKVYHLNQDDPLSWSRYYSRNVNQNFGACNKDPNVVPLDQNMFTDTNYACQTRTPSENLLDGHLVRLAKQTLDFIVTKRHEPFFMAVGIYKPHQPFHANIQFWDLYRNAGVPDAERITPPEPRESFVERLTFDLESDIRSPLWSENTAASDRLRRTLRMGYMAALSQSDAFVGGLLAKLDQLKLSDSTLIAFLGDNGFSLGEQGMFGKDTMFEMATRVPVAFTIPWLASSSARRIARLPDFFSTLDLLPTVAALMNIKLNPKYAIHGVSHGPRIALRASDRTGLLDNVKPPQSFAFGELVRCKGDCTFLPLSKMTEIGYTIRTDDWRYTVYLHLSGGKARWNQGIISEELYSHQNDRQTLLDLTNASFETETANVADSHRLVCLQLFQQIAQRFNVSYTEYGMVIGRR